MTTNGKPRLPVGAHDECVVIDHFLTQTQGGKDRLTIIVEKDGMIASWDGYFTEKAWKQTEKALVALGWDPAANDYRIDLINGTGALVGRKCHVQVESESYTKDDGTVVNTLRARWLNPVGGGNFTQERTDDNAARDLASRLKAAIVSKKGGLSQAPKAPAAPVLGTTPPASDDDIPF